MDFLSQKLRDFANIFVTHANKEKPQREVSRFEVYLEYIYKVLSWDDYSLTITVFLIHNFLFWLIVQWQVKFFGVIFLLLLIGYIWDTYFQTKQLDGFRGQYSEVLDEFYSIFWDVVFNLKALRKDSPSSFCIGMSFFFLSMSFIARSISGYLLTYITLLGIFFIPLALQLLPEEYLDRLNQFFKAIISSKDVLAEDELMPFISEKDFNRGDPDLESLLTDRTADSVTNSFTSGLHSMPSYLDVDNSRDDLEEDDLLPLPSTKSHSPGDLSSDSDSDHKGIHFDSAHFNGDTSSEEENNYVKGLQLTKDMLDNAKELNPNREGFGGIFSNMATMGGSLVANVIKSAITKPAVKARERNSSSSDSDFEMVNSEDIDGKS